MDAKEQSATLDTLYLDLEVIGVESGLSSGLVYKVAQDHDGYLWAATNIGLNRYDGNRVKQYLHIEGDELSLPEDDVNDVFVDSRGWLWVVTVNFGLHLYDKKTESFLPASVLAQYRCIREDQWSNIWIMDHSGEWQVISVKASIEEISKHADLQRFIQVDRIQDVFEGLPDLSESSNFVLTENHKLWSVDQDTLTIYHLDYPKNKATLTNSGKVISSTGIAKYPIDNWLIENKIDGFIYFFDRDKYHQLDPKNGEIIQTVLLPERLAPAPMQPRMVDDRGRILARNDFNIYRVEPQTGGVSILRKAGIESRNPKWRFLCYEPLLDRNNNIWFPSIGNGIYKYAGDRERFNYYGLDHTGPSVPYIVSIGPELIGFMDLQLKLFDAAQQELTQLLDFKDLGFVHPFAGYPCRLIIGPEGKLWTRADENLYSYLFQIDLDGTVEQQFSTGRYPHESFGSEWIFWNQDGTLWSVIVGVDKPSLKEVPHLSLDYWDILGDGTKQRYTFKDHPEGFLFGECRYQSQTPDGTIWLAMSNGGVVCFNPGNGLWRHFKHEKGNPNSLSSNRTLFVLPDHLAPDSIMWIGTYQGLNKLDIARNSFTVYTTDDGLPNDVIYGLLPDDRNNFWISTNKGLCRFNPQTKESKTFTSKDGIQNDEFNKGAFAKDPNGIMYFGGVGGLTWFDPNDFYEEVQTSPMVINGLRVFNEKVHYNRDGSVRTKGVYLKTPIGEADAIELPHHADMITFEYANLNLSGPKSNQYRYRLEGFNDNWIDAKYQNEATFTNLPPGKYTFSVQGSDSHGSWSEQVASIDLKILSPWWGTLWFWCIIIALIAYFAYRGYRNRLFQKRRMQVLRNRISRDLHDEIGSTLSSITLFGAVAKQNLNGAPQMATDMLDRIDKDTSSMIESMNDIVWAIKSDNDKMEHVINRMRAFTSGISEAANWQIEYNFSPAIVDLELSMVQRRDLYLIFKEAVNNAIKYSGSKKLSITLTYQGNLVSMCIADNGKGFDYKRALNNMSSLGGNGLKNMMVRAADLKGKIDIRSLPGEGTVVELLFDPSLEAAIH